MEKSESLISCNICKIRKVKCGRELPMCSYCSKRGITCIYPDRIGQKGVSETGLNSFMNESSQPAVTIIQSNNTQKFQTHILLILSTQIVEYDKELIPQIGFFVNKLELGVIGALLKFSIHESGMDSRVIKSFI
ncbi:hypothetical protein CONCODRAFT_12348 [Conidiobolus coronatus NRRL 28638]|uniref:Zn(2)-C6 fungal-type domain-containing protein n=1 Tax=Conidiobolus coronatus (strain ATCC 28846 / CBS 209.66 / NRRL 28638) TaxID=796925 RepID=A0A137NT93_CONC2|nr:hypothetical protein CONCODRAFT_12348 [Conidiobolus coronatus NRRL 28638]|eukprot:KXN65939.1 hypothetical protein CONCODRAFT_12348 [Conidiobolus coronatus NRRL 28638]